MSTANPIPATFLRGGTSKGIFLDKSVLPTERSHWDPIFLGIMGSPDPEHGRQLNGMGGGISSLSKICVVGPPSLDQKAKGIQVEYTFVQIGVRDSSIDYSGNCGNLSSMIGVFAVDQGICTLQTAPGSTHATIRSFNTNTQKIIDTTFPISDLGTPVLDLPQATVAGVPGQASKILLDFVNPGGARTGKLLPSGNATDLLDISIPSANSASAPPIHPIKVSLVDATNPTVFVDYAQLNQFLPMDDYFKNKSPATEEVNPILESIRQQGAQKMGLDPSAQAQPKIAILSAPHESSDLSQGVSIVVHALSMGILHKGLPITIGLCVGVASKTEGTIAWDIAVQSSRARTNDSIDLVRLKHPGGLVDVGAEFDDDGIVKSAKVVRTGRRLMKGVVWY